MFQSLKNEPKSLNHSGRSYVSESFHVNGDVRSSGALDVAGVINGNVYANDMVIEETGSITGAIEVTKIEVNGHIEGKIIADTVIIGKTAVIKGDIFFRDTLKTEEGADIDGYIKRSQQGASTSDEEIDIQEIIQRPDTVSYTHLRAHET